MRKQGIKVTVALVSAVCVLLGVGFAMGRITGGSRRSQGIYRGFQGGPGREQILRLRQEDPEKFNQFVSRRKGQLRDRISKLKETDPQRYERIRQRTGEGQMARLDSLRDQNPQGFRQAMHKHQGRLQQHLEALKVGDPELYQQITEHQDGLRRLRQLHNRGDSEQARKFLEENPELGDIWDKMRSMRDTSKGGFRGYAK